LDEEHVLLSVLLGLNLHIDGNYQIKGFWGMAYHNPSLEYDPIRPINAPYFISNTRQKMATLVQAAM